MIQKSFTQNFTQCFDKGLVQPLKAQCALKILNRLLPQYPTHYNIAKFLIKHLQTLVDNKNKVDQKLWALALGCKNNLEKKTLTMPDRPPDAIIAPVVDVHPVGGAGERFEEPSRRRRSSSRDNQTGSSAKTGKSSRDGPAARIEPDTKDNKRVQKEKEKEEAK